MPTIGGGVSSTNLSAPDHFNASILMTLEYDYERAAAFDVAMLEALGTATRTIRAEPWPRAVTFEGPRLADVLAAAGRAGSRIVAVDITVEEIAARDWIVAVKGDGACLGIGGRGPVWVAYDVPGGRGGADDEARWTRAVFYIRAE